MSKLIRKYVYVSYSVQAINVIVNFIYSLIIVRQLGDFGYGEYSVFYNSLSFSVLLLGFNLPSVVVFFITNKRIDPAKLMGFCFLVTFVTALFLLLVLSQSDAWGLAPHIFPGGNNKSLWIFFFVMQFFLMQSNQLLAALLNAHRIFIPVAAITLVSNMGLLLFWTAVTFRLFHPNIALFNLIWWVNIVVNISIAIFTAWYAVQKRILRSFGRWITMAELRGVVGFALIVYLCNTLQFLNYKMDIWFVHYFKGEKETGVYALALSLAQLIWILPNAISVVLLNYFQVKEKEYSIQLAINYARFTIYFSAFSALALWIVYYFALPVIYGPAFVRCIKLTGILFLGTVPFSLSIIIANLNSGIGFVRFNLYATLLTFILGVLLDLLFIPVYGIEGAAVAKVVIYIIGLIFQIIVGKVFYKLQWLNMFRIPTTWKL